MKTTNSIKIERINKNFDRVWNEFSYKNQVEIFNTYKMLLNWYMAKNEQVIDIIYNASATDRLDFFSSTSFAFIKIDNGNIKSFPEQQVVNRIDKNYIMCQGVVISIHNDKLAKVTGLLINYMLECRNDLGYAISYSKK